LVILPEITLFQMNITFQSFPMSYARNIPVAIVVLLSAAGWYWGDHITGNQGWLMWLAPVPVLIFAFRSTAKQAFAVAFVAYLLGRLGFFAYLTRVIPLPIAILVTILQPLFIAGIVLLTRKMVLAKESWLAVLVFPVLWTTFEFLIFLVSADGTAASIAYSQMNYGLIIQVASLTGISGITFIITLIPSGLALVWHYRQNSALVKQVLGITGIMCLLSLGYGWARLSASDAPVQWKVGLVTLSEKHHHFNDALRTVEEPKLEKETVEAYIQQIHLLARQGAQWVVIPEKVINVDAETQDSIMSLFQKAARKDRVGIVAGVTFLAGDYKENVSFVFSPDGKMLSRYNKANMVRGWEDSFRIGHEVSLFMNDQVKLGTAICKDLDFPTWMRQYHPAVILFVPAWDFVIDGWLHSRMAFLRCVENGYGMVRAGRQGRLSIVDAYGTVLAEANCENGQQTVLLGNIPVQKSETFYSRAGNWFGWFITFAAVAFLAGLIVNSSRSRFLTPIAS
jgi:apolipoprotein N-acyltransferase